MIYPISKDQVYCYAQLCQPKNKITGNHKHKENLTEIFKSYAPLVVNLIKHTNENDIIRSQLQSVPRLYFYHGKIAFIGDASNACSPLLQQGAAAALEDAISLATMLKNYPVNEALEKHKQFRYPRISWIVEHSDQPIARLSNNPSRIKAFARDLLISRKGPLNVRGWKQLFKHDFITQLNDFVSQKQS